MLAGLTLLYPSTSRLLVWPWALGGAVLWLAPVLVLLVRLARIVDFRLPPPLITAGIGLLAAATCASAALSPFSAATLPRVWPTLGGCALYLVLHDAFARRPERIAASARTLAIFGAVIAVASVVLWRLFASTSRNGYPFGHSNYTAGFIVLLAPWLVFQVWVNRGIARGLWVIALSTGLSALYGTSSRAGVLALLAGATLVTALALVRAKWSRWKKLLLVASLACVSLAGILANSRLRALLLDRAWSDSAQASNRQRDSMLGAGLLLGIERPLLGWGPGSVPLVYPKVRASAGGGIDNVVQLHSTPAQLWASLGGAGTAAILMLAGGTILILRPGRITRREVIAVTCLGVSICYIVLLGFLGSGVGAVAVFAIFTLLGVAAILMLAISTLREMGRRSYAPPEIAALSSLGGYAALSLTDHQLDVPAIAALALFGLAVITRSSSSAPKARTAATLLLSALTIGLLVPLQRDLRARHAYASALDLLAAGDLVGGLAKLDYATTLAPYDPYFQHQAAGALLALRDATTDPAHRLQLTRDVRTRLERSLAAGVHLEFPHFNLGWLCLELDDPTTAARHFTAAARLVPDKGGVYLGLGLALLEMKRPTDAIRAFALEALNDPRSALAPVWETPALAPLRPAIRAETAKLYIKLSGRFAFEVERAAPWASWWAGENVPPSDLRGFSSESRAFPAALPAIAAGRTIDASAPWAALYRAWLARDFSALGVDASTQAALARRAQRHGGDFTAFLRAGTEDEPALLRTLRRSRPGYGVLALHPDGPPLTDLYIVQENVVHADFAAGLFPAKGWLSGRSLLQLLPELGPAQETGTPSRP